MDKSTRRIKIAEPRGFTSDEAEYVEAEVARMGGSSIDSVDVQDGTVVEFHYEEDGNQLAALRWYPEQELLLEVTLAPSERAYEIMKELT